MVVLDLKVTEQNHLCIKWNFNLICGVTAFPAPLQLRLPQPFCYKSLVCTQFDKLLIVDYEIKIRFNAFIVYMHYSVVLGHLMVPFFVCSIKYSESNRFFFLRALEMLKQMDLRKEIKKARLLHLRRTKTEILNKEMMMILK